MFKMILIMFSLLLVGCALVPGAEVQTIQDVAPAPSSATAEIHFIDVGQGDSILIKTNKIVLIDCGKSGEKVTNYLKNRVSSIDTLVITHGDFDHLGGCDSVLKQFEVGEVVVDGQERETESYKDVFENIKPSTPVIRFPNVGYQITPELVVVHSNTNSDEPNMNSIVTKLSFGNTEVLFTADCDRDCEQNIITKNIDVDIVQIPHHGSKYGTSYEFITATSPELAVVSVGSGNNYGHPSPEVLERIGSINLKRTDVDGSVVIILNETDWRFYE